MFVILPIKFLGIFTSRVLGLYGDLWSMGFTLQNKGGMSPLGELVKSKAPILCIMRLVLGTHMWDAHLISFFKEYCE